MTGIDDLTNLLCGLARADFGLPMLLQQDHRLRVQCFGRGIGTAALRRCRLRASRRRLAAHHAHLREDHFINRVRGIAGECLF